MTANRKDHSIARPRTRGYSLIELLIVVAIVAGLAVAAVATYSSYVVKTKRAAAAAVLLGIANRQEQYFLDAREYAADMAALGAAAPPEVAENYTIATTPNNGGTPPTYTVTATPTGSQATRDTKCATLTLTSAGAKSISGSGALQDCW